MPRPIFSAKDFGWKDDDNSILKTTVRSTSVSKPRPGRPAQTSPAPNGRPAQAHAKGTPGSDSKAAVRKDKVERARKLIADPGYPPPKVIQSVARLLARTWGEDTKRRSK